MRVVAAFVAVLAVLVLAGCLAPVASDDPAEEPTATALSVTERSADAGFAYASTEEGVGNGNDGLYVADYDGDLREDVLAIGGESPVLLHNTGDGFERSGALPDLPGTGRVQSALWFDHDGDGDEDLLLLRRGAKPALLENDDGRFQRHDAGFETAFENPVGATTADYDGDGCLDLFVVQYGRWSETTPEAWNNQFFDVDNGNPNALYRGHCGDGFERVEDAGVGPGADGAHWSMAASFVDLTGDGHPDVHVANDYYNDTVYRNEGNGTFTRDVLGAATDRNGMSSEVADLTGDGRPDVFVTNIYYDRNRIADLAPIDRRLVSNYLANRLGKRLEGNTLLVHTDDGFEDRASELGIAKAGWGWAAVVADLDSDGDPDVFHGTQDELRFDRDDPYYSYPFAWVNHGGAFYEQNASEIGFDLTDDRGVARLDYDLDGALDLGIATYDDAYRLYRNDGPQGESLQVVVDGGSDGPAIGATIETTVNGETRTHVRDDGSDYQSQDSRAVHVGAGDADSVDELRVRWPDGAERAFEDVATGQRIRVTPDGIRDRIAYGE